MLKLGELLKGKRKERNLELPQASESTKIPQRLLEALENGEYGLFSSEVYLQGFLKNYAKFLGIDINKALAIYRRERENIKNEEIFGNRNKPIEEPKAIITPGRLVVAITVIIIIAIVTFLAVQVNKLIKPPYLELTEPASGKAPTELSITTESDQITLAGKVEVGSKLLVNGSEVNTNNLQEFRVDNFKLNPGSNVIYIVAESYYFSKTSQIKLTVVSNFLEEQEELQSTEESTQEVNKMIIEIEVGPEDAWVVAKVDGETKLADTLEAGQTFKYESLSEFTIYSPRPQMVKLKISGEEYSFSAQVESVFKLLDGEVVQE